MKTIRQVKTVFIIFIAFVCCWSPYIVVLLYDNADSLPLPVHMYTSMLAHLHASLNFAIYGLSNREFLARYLHRLVACCRHPLPSPGNAASSVFNNLSCGVHRTIARGAARCAGEVDVNRTLVTVECHQFHGVEGCHDAAAETSSACRPPFSISAEDECWHDNAGPAVFTASKWFYSRRHAVPPEAMYNACALLISSVRSFLFVLLFYTSKWSRIDCSGQWPGTSDCIRLHSWRVCVPTSHKHLLSLARHTANAEPLD